MTTTDAELSIKEVYTSQQVTRLAALQDVSEFVHVIFGTTTSGVLIDLAEYVIGDDEPFDPVAEAHKAMAEIRYERGENYNGYDDTIADWDDDPADYDGYDDGEAGYCYGDGPLADWERELLAGVIDKPVIGDITVSDLAGFLTLPTTAVLLDEDGDTWHYDYSAPGWVYGGYDHPRTPGEIFTELAYFTGRYNFIVTNPEVLS